MQIGMVSIVYPTTYVEYDDIDQPLKTIAKRMTGHILNSRYLYSRYFDLQKHKFYD